MEFVSDWAHRAITTYILPSLNDSSPLSAIASQVTSYLAEITENSNLNSKSYNPESAHSYSSSSSSQSAKMPFDPVAYLTQFFNNNINDQNNYNTNSYLTSFFPTNIQSLLPTLVSPFPAPLRAIILSTVSTTIWLTTYTTSLASALLSNSSSSLLSSTSSTSSSKPTLLLLFFTSILTLYLTLRLLAFVRRLISYTVRLAVRLTFWAGLVALAAWCYGRGLEKTIGDVVGITAFWWEEWGRFSAQQSAAAAGAANGQNEYGRDQERMGNRYDGSGSGGGGYGYGREGVRIR